MVLKSFTLGHPVGCRNISKALKLCHRWPITRHLIEIPKPEYFQVKHEHTAIF
jgi:hypothetical protein